MKQQRRVFLLVLWRSSLFKYLSFYFSSPNTSEHPQLSPPPPSLHLSLPPSVSTFRSSEDEAESLALSLLQHGRLLLDHVVADAQKQTDCKRIVWRTYITVQYSIYDISSFVQMFEAFCKLLLLFYFFLNFIVVNCKIVVNN